MNKHRSVTLFIQTVVEREARVSSELIDLINDQNPKDVKKRQFRDNLTELEWPKGVIW